MNPIDKELYQERSRYGTELSKHYPLPSHDKAFTYRVMQSLPRRNPSPVPEHRPNARQIMSALCRAICSPWTTVLALVGCLLVWRESFMEQWREGCQTLVQNLPELISSRFLFTTYLAISLLFVLYCIMKVKEANET